MKLYIYRISQDENTKWDTYDSAVVIAESEQEARETHPSENNMSYSMAETYGKEYQRWNYAYASWASHPDKVSVELVGEAAPGLEKGVVCASFNAG